jgi:hypothetical protein
MAITRAQQFRQMLENGGMLVQPSMTGKRPGYRGDAAARSSGAADSGRVGGSDVGESSTSSDSRDDGPDDRGTREQNRNQRAVQRAARVRDIENYIDRPTFGFTDAAKFNIAPLPIKILQGLAGIFPSSGTPRTSVQPIGGGGGDGSQMQTVPLWAQLGFNSEAEYLASLPAQRKLLETETDDQDEGLRLAYRANGGRIGAAEGGIMDLETGRQMYFLGKLVKKATRAVKKVVKSPIGKAALLYAATAGLGSLGAGGGLSSLFKLNTFAPATVKANLGTSFARLMGGKLMADPTGLFAEGQLPGKQNIFQKALGLVKDNPFEAITAVSAVAGLLTPAQENQAQQLADNTGIDIEEARNQILRAAAGQDDFRARAFKADGGIMRLGYQEGSKEPVAKKTMPLLDMGGKEMDLREDGGFVPIGRMEKADDVPARLSKNEFVFTADAVRNAGDGNVDKGAEVMYNMMKNLESGGDVSEESQGLSGARRMFQTSQRLEEVL